MDPRTRTIISTGYNGFPRGIEDTPERLNDRPRKLALTIHAELNAIINAARVGASTDGTALYIHGLPPCLPCALAIIQAGISIVNYDGMPDANWQESCNEALARLGEAGVLYQYLEETL